MAISGLLGGIYSLIVWGITYFKVFRHFEWKGLGFSIRSIPEMEQLGFDIPIWKYMMAAMLMRIIIGIYIGIVIGIIVQMLAVPTQNMIVSLLIFVMPLCISFIGQMQYENPLIQFIRQYLAVILKPVEYLASFPTVWFTTGIMEMLVFAAIPVVGLYLGYKKYV